MKKRAKRPTRNRTKFDAMTDEQVHKAALSDPDAKPLTKRQLAKMRRPSPSADRAALFVLIRQRQ